MSKKTADLADSYLARGVAHCIAPEDIEDGYAPPGCMSDLMHGGINDAGTWQQSGPDPYFADFEGTGDQDITMTQAGRSHPQTDETWCRYEDTSQGARQLGPSRNDHPEPSNYRHDNNAKLYPGNDWNEDYRSGPGTKERSPRMASFTDGKTQMDRAGHGPTGGNTKKKFTR
jgi:hypothetical protein